MSKEIEKPMSEFKVISLLPFWMIGLVVMIFGCVAGWLYAAFLQGVTQGIKDWKEF